MVAAAKHGSCKPSPTGVPRGNEIKDPAMRPEDDVSPEQPGDADEQRIADQGLLVDAGFNLDDVGTPTDQNEDEHGHLGEFSQQAQHFGRVPSVHRIGHAGDGNPS